MAKRKKQTRKRKKQAAVEASSFWPLAGAICLIILAVFILLGGFGGGGPLPNGLFHGTYWALGWAAYYLPIALLFLAITKFRTEDNRVPLTKLISIIISIVSLSTWFYIIGIYQFKGGWVGGHGGNLGKLIGNISLLAITKMPASFVFLTLTIFSILFSLDVSPKIFAKLAVLLKNRDKEPDSDLAALKSSPGFKLNEGVPVENSGMRTNRLSTFKNAAQKVSPSDNHEALTTASDPGWKFPSINLLNQQQDKADAGNVASNAQSIQDTLANFNIPVEMEGANVGPRVTQFTLKPSNGVKLTKITNLETNLALDLAAHSIRIEAPIPGKKAVGIEVPNVKAAIVRVSSLLKSREWQSMSSPLGIIIGCDIAGAPVVYDLAKMPHLLVAGQTGSGKSVMINTILTSLLYHNSPSDLKLILVDPKQVEMAPYNDLPHLLTPVINDPEKCISALKWAVAEMDRRLKALAEVGRRNIEEYNELKKEAGMPYIVIVIDELADLMMMAARDVEALIVRIAQKARAAGIHLVLATQRPSVDVITGLIKANVPARIAFTTASQIDSRTIIDQMGAEKLLGQGDLLFLTSDMPKPKRVQAAYISGDETSKVNDFIRMQRAPQYDDEIISQPVQLNGKGGIVADYGANNADDEMWKDALHVVIEGRKASTSLLQRRLRIGYGRAARLIETMEEQGIVGHADGSRPREVLISSIDEVLGGNNQPAELESEDDSET